MVTRKAPVDLRANESLAVEASLGRARGEPLYGRLWLWLLHGGKLAQLSGSACKVYCALVCRADFKTLGCYPSVRCIARDAGLGRSTVFSALGELVREGLVRRISGDGQNNRYVIVRSPVQNPEGSKGKAKKPRPQSGLLPVQVSDSAGPESGPKQQTINESHKTTADRAGKSLSGSDGNLRRVLYRIGLSREAVAEIMGTWRDRPASVWAAVANGQALAQTGGIEKSLAAYVRAVLREADREELEVRPTSLARQREKELCQQAQTVRTAEREKRAARQREAHRRWGDMDRWPEVAVAEV